MTPEEFQTALGEIAARTKASFDNLLQMHCTAIIGLASSDVVSPPDVQVNPEHDPMYQLLMSTQQQMTAMNTLAGDRLAESTRDFFEKIHSVPKTDQKPADQNPDSQPQS